VGELPAAQSLANLVQRLKEFLGIDHVQYVGDLRRTVRRVAVACGAAGSFLAATRQADCEVLVLGETNLHTCVEADASGTALVLAGHYASERFAVERLAAVLAGRFRDVDAWASSRESDPLRLC
jgi:putative NIF3 family GTP cyclohydrolase 1 type 2